MLCQPAYTGFLKKPSLMGMASSENSYVLLHGGLKNECPVCRIPLITNDNLKYFNHPSEIGNVCYN